MKEYMISTVDNPYNPFENFDEWLAFDIEKGYYSFSKLARLCNYESTDSTVESSIKTENAIDRLIELDPLSMFIKVSNDVDQEETEEVSDLN